MEKLFSISNEDNGETQYTSHHLLVTKVYVPIQCGLGAIKFCERTLCHISGDMKVR